MPIFIVMPLIIVNLIVGCTMFIEGIYAEKIKILDMPIECYIILFLGYMTLGLPLLLFSLLRLLVKKIT